MCPIKERENKYCCSYCGQILSLLASWKNASLQFSYQHQPLCSVEEKIQFQIQPNEIRRITISTLWALWIRSRSTWIGWLKNTWSKAGVINDPLGQPSVPAGSDCRLILKFCDGLTDGRTLLCENSDHYRPCGRPRGSIFYLSTSIQFSFHNCFKIKYLKYSFALTSAINFFMAQNQELFYVVNFTEF